MSMSSEEEADKENAPLHKRRKRKNMEGTDTGEKIGRRGCGLKPGGQYLKEIAKRFQRPGGSGRGRITLHQPLDVFDFSQVANVGKKRKSLSESKEDVNSQNAKGMHLDFLTVKDTRNGKVKEHTMQERIKLRREARGECHEEEASDQPKDQKPSLENFRVFCARNKVTAMEQRPLASLPSETFNSQDWDTSLCLFQKLAAKRRRGNGSGKLLTKPSPLNMSALEERFRQMDQEALVEDDPDVDLDLGEIAETSDPERASRPFVSIPSEPFNSEESGISSPQPHQLAGGRGAIMTNYTTFDLRNFQERSQRRDQGALCGDSSDMDLEHEAVPEPCLSERAVVTIKQQTPTAEFPSVLFNNEDAETSQRSDIERVELALAQTVEAVQVWSVELDPSRRRRESIRASRLSARPKTLILSPLQSLNSQAIIAKNTSPQDSHCDRRIQESSPNEIALSPDKSRDDERVETSPEKCLNASLEVVELEPSPTESDSLELVNSWPASWPKQITSTSNQFETTIAKSPQGSQDSKPEIDVDLRRDSIEILSSRPLVLPNQRVETGSENSLELASNPPLTERARPVREGEDRATTPLLEQAIPSTPGTSPTPPTNPLSIFGYPYSRRACQVDLGQRRLAFGSPKGISGEEVEKNTPWTVDYALVQQSSFWGAEGSIPNQQGLVAASQEDALPLDDDATSSDNNDAYGLDYPGGAEDTISDDRTCIVQTGASSSHNDQEGTSHGNASNDNGVLCQEPRPQNIEDGGFGHSTGDPSIFALTNLEDIEQFVNALQVNGPPLGNNDAQEEDRSSKDFDVDDEPVVENPAVQQPEQVVREGSDNGPQGEGGPENLLDTSSKDQATPSQDKEKQLVLASTEHTPKLQQNQVKKTRRNKALKIASPLEAGSKWSNGKRISTRIKSKPLEYWRGEKMLYGRVHSTLTTLIGIKHLSPDPVWPKPQPRCKEKDAKHYKVDSFVPAKYDELIRLAAQ